MCGGITYQIGKIKKSNLAKFYPKDQIEKFLKDGFGQSFFWNSKPVLPVEDESGTQLVMWGNRSKDVKLPKTGWAKKESIDDGKWAYLKPNFVKIPANKGYEKGVWFDISEKGLKGLVIEKEKQKRAYIITKPADENYLRLTKHNRQPIENS